MSTVTQKTDAETSRRKPPELHPNLDLLKSEKLPSQSKPWPERELPVDVLVVTGESCELLSCLSHLNKGSIYKSYKMAIGHVFFGKIGQQNELMKIAVMECSVGSTDTSLTVLDAVQELGPKAVFCVGFCGGLDDTKVNLGDVVISKMVRTYTSVSVMEEGTMDRNIGVPVPSYIGGVLKRADDSWIPPLKNPLELDPIRHKDGVFLSGPEEVNNKKRCDELVKHFSDAIAIERQGEDLYKVADRRSLQWAVIKAVSHFIDGRDQPNTDSWRLFASVLAASLTFNILKDTNVFKEWPHYKSEYTGPSQESWSKEKESGPSYQGSKRVESQSRPLVQVQPVPCASPMIATCTSTLPTAAQTHMAVVPQAQPSVLMPTQQQVPNSLVLYATPAGTIPLQCIVPQVVAQIPTQYQSCMVPTIPGIPGVPGQVDVNTAAQHGVPTVQPVPQFTTPGQTTAHQRFFHLPAIVPPGTRLQSKVPSSHTTSHQQNQWHRQVTRLVDNQLLQNTSLQGGTQWPKWTQVTTPQPQMNVQPVNVYGQYRQQTLQYQTQPQQTAAGLTSETVVPYQQPKQVQEQRQLQQQLGVLPSLMAIVPGAPHQGSPSVVTATRAHSNAFSAFPDASVAPQHQASQLVTAPGWYAQPSQKRAADGDAGQQGPANKRLC